MDPSRIRLEDDRFGLIGAAFRPGNRTIYNGRRGDDHIWSIGIIVGPDDDIQTVEIDDHGAKSSRMLTSGERFEGLDILAAPGAEAYIIAGTFTLMGMELGAVDQGTTHDFADILRAAADDHSWRLPLRVVGHPRDLQLSAQGRDILRETAATLERDGTATTSLAAARRLELSEQALDSIRRRISRTSLQAYRMHGRWYVVLDNLARSRSTPPTVEEAPEAVEEPIATMAAAPEPEEHVEPAGAPTEDDLAAFAEPEVAEPDAPVEESEPEPPAEPSVEYVEDEPAAEAEQAVAAAEVAEPETVGVELEATAPDLEEESEPATDDQATSGVETVVPKTEPVAEESSGFEDLAAEPIREEPIEAGSDSVESEAAPAAEPDMADEYRAAATTPAPAEQTDQEIQFPEPVITDEAPESVVESEAEEPEASMIDAESPAEPETPTIEAEAPAELEASTIEVDAPAEPEIEAESPTVEGEAQIDEGLDDAWPSDLATGEVDLADVVAPEPEPPTVGMAAASIEEPVVAEDLLTVEQTSTEEPAPNAEMATEESESEIERPTEAAATESAEESEEFAAEPEASVDAPVADELAAEPEQLADGLDTDVPAESAAEDERSAPPAAEATIEQTVIVIEEQVVLDLSSEDVSPSETEPDLTEPVQSEEALLFAEMVEQATGAEASGAEPAATELESDVAEQSDELIAEHVAEAANENGEVAHETSEDEIDVEAAAEPSDEVIAEGIRTHVPVYADEVGRDELIESSPKPGATEEPADLEVTEASDVQAEPESAAAEDVATEPETAEPAEAVEDEPEQTGGPSAASYFSDTRGGAGARGATPPHTPQTDIATHLRGEVAFLRQQSREKDRQIGVWGDGAKWLQPFVDQIRSLEKQVERLGELQVQRESERISDLISERDALRQRLETLEAKISATQAVPNVPAEPNRRSWFRRMMGSE